MSQVTLPEFIDMSLALWTEENLRTQPLRDFSSILEQLTPSDAKVERPIPRQEVKQQNEASMAALQAMLKGVQNAPTRKPRRRK